VCAQMLQLVSRVLQAVSGYARIKQRPSSVIDKEVIRHVDFQDYSIQSEYTVPTITRHVASVVHASTPVTTTPVTRTPATTLPEQVSTSPIIEQFTINFNDTTLPFTPTGQLLELYTCPLSRSFAIHNPFIFTDRLLLEQGETLWVQTDDMEANSKPKQLCYNHRPIEKVCISFDSISFSRVLISHVHSNLLTKDPPSRWTIR